MEKPGELRVALGVPIKQRVRLDRQDVTRVSESQLEGSDSDSEHSGGDGILQSRKFGTLNDWSKISKRPMLVQPFLSVEK